jgi:hypothetical protein
MRRLAILPLLLLLSTPAAAAVFRATSVEETALGAEAIVRGRVEARVSRWTADHRRIVTDVTVTVTQAWKGAPGPQVIVTLPGGTVGRIGQHVDAAPSFADGEEVVVFLSRAGGGWRLAGLALGKYRVRAETGEVEPDLDAVRFDASPVGAGQRLVGAMRLDELERRVRAAR